MNTPLKGATTGERTAAEQLFLLQNLVVQQAQSGVDARSGRFMKRTGSKIRLSRLIHPLIETINARRKMLDVVRIAGKGLVTGRRLGGGGSRCIVVLLRNDARN